MKVLSTWQFFSLIFLFQLGTNVLFGFAGGARQDAWIAVGIGTAIGSSLIWMFTKIYEWYPEENWISLLVIIFGRYIGNILAMIYNLAFIYEAARVLRDYGELMSTFLLPRTPIGFQMFLFLVLISYACFAGLERMARLAELCILIVFLSFFGQITLLAISNVIHISWLTPIGADWKRIGTTVFPLGITTTFGETIAFAAFWTLTVQPSKYRKAALLSSILVGLILMTLDIVAVGTLGSDMFFRALYPLLSTFQLISIADFIDNLDAVIITNFSTGVLFKVAIYTYAACAGITAQWKAGNHRAVIIPVSALVWLLAFYMAENISSHIFIGLKWLPWVIELPLFVVIPLLVFIIASIKKKVSS